VVIAEGEKEIILEELQNKLRPTHFIDGIWYADYKKDQGRSCEGKNLAKGLLLTSRCGIPNSRSALPKIFSNKTLRNQIIAYTFATM
jgi:hypothetical protein